MLELQPLIKTKTIQYNVNFKKVKQGDILLFTQKDGIKYFRQVKNFYKKGQTKIFVLSKKIFLN